MGTPYTFDRGMWCHSTSIELFYFDDNFSRIPLWVLALQLDVSKDPERKTTSSVSGINYGLHPLTIAVY